MFKKILIAAVAVGAMAVNAPIASAAAVTADCGFNTIAQETVTGGQDTFTGAAYGYAVSDTPGASISVTCEVRVNGGTVDSTDPGPFGQASVTAGQVTYVATDTDTVTLCAVWTGSESGELCGGTSTQQIPPEEVFTVLDQVFAILISVAEQVDATLAPVYALLTEIEKTYVDPTACLVLAAVGNIPGADVPGVLEINEQGDIFLLAEPFWDCPPYDLFG